MQSISKAKKAGDLDCLTLKKYSTMKIEARINAVSPVIEGTSSRTGKEYRLCEVVLEVAQDGRYDYILAKAFDEKCDFCQQYDMNSQPPVAVNVEMFVDNGRGFSARKYMSCSIGSIELA